MDAFVSVYVDMSATAARLNIKAPQRVERRHSGAQQWRRN
jgi:hypothetical protein